MPEASVYATTLADVGSADPSVFVVDAGLASSMQTGLFHERFPSRYINLGIAEANAVGFASGLARRGFKPIVHSFGNFLARRAHDQVAISVALPCLAITLVGGSCGVFDGRNGPSHLAGDDLATFTALPNFRVYEPADAVDLALALTEAVGSGGPSYLRLRRHGMPTAIGKRDNRGPVRLVCDGGSASRATLVVIGNLLDEVMVTARILADDGIGVDLYHVVRIKPLEIAPILASARRSGRAIVIENHVPSGGGAQAVVAALAPAGLPITTLTLPDAFLPAGDPRWLAAQAGLDATTLTARISAELARGVS
ncbi:MAG: transketolase C-terminal domain-containing protein [Reyranella sp.]|nr:transketolase C-terminal domain-containing protein [Reyranella sp.]